MFYVLRIWLLYFDYQKNKQLLKFKWKSQLKIELQSHNSKTNENELEDYMRNNVSSSISSKSDNIPWAIKYQHLFRNSIKMHFYCVVVGIIIATTTLTSFYLDKDTLFNYVQWSWAFVFCTIMLIGAYQIQKCRDELDIRGRCISH